MISVLLATTGRPDMAEAFVRSLKTTTRGHPVELVAAVDADPETRKRIVMGSAGMPRLVLDYSDDYRGCSRAWNDALARASGDPIVLAADDLVFEPGWLDAALEKLTEFEDGWGFVGFNDGHMGADLSTHYLMSRRFIVEHLGGVIAWECYRHSFNDCEANERAKRAGRYAWCVGAVVRHQHWLFGERAQDDTDARNLGGHPESQQAYAYRAANDFPNDYEAVIT